MATKSKEKQFASPESLKKAFASLDKDFGKNTAFQSKNYERPKVGFIKSGSLNLDIALGGGWAKGRISEVYAQESVGKTTLALLAIADVQRNGELAAFIDMEHALDLDYAEKLGVDVDNLIISQPDYGEQALEVADRMLTVPEVGFICMDSVSALVPKAELEGEMGESKMGLQARLMGQAMRKLTGAIHKSGTHMMFINQIREKIGIVFGNPETTSGGNALKFYCSQRVRLRRGELYKNKDNVDDVLGHAMSAKVEKNKVSPPFKKAVIPLIYGFGVDYNKEVVQLAVSQGIVKKSGSWYSYMENKLGQGENTVVSLLDDNLELRDEILSKLDLT